jgi:hypothetical protein
VLTPEINKFTNQEGDYPSKMEYLLDHPIEYMMRVRLACCIRAVDGFLLTPTPIVW